MDVIQNRLLKGGVEGVPRRRWSYASANGQLLYEWCLCKRLDSFSISVDLFSGAPLGKKAVNV